MRIKIEYTIKAILFGVDETVIKHLNFGNSYLLEKDSLTNYKLWKEFDYTDFGMRRIYETSKLNDNLEIALLTKKENVEYDALESIVDNQKMINHEDVYKFIWEFENKELSYVDKTMRHIRLFSENCFNIKELLFKCTVKNIDDKIIIPEVESKIPLPDRILDNIEKLHIENDLEASKLNDFIKNIENDILSSAFSSKILSQACFLYDQSYTATIDTLRFMVCVIGLESILLNGKVELSYKFSRNGAMLLSNSAEEYWELSKKLKDIYDKRSSYVHTGSVKKLKKEDIVYSRDILRKVIFKVLDKNMSQEDLLKDLEVKGY